jgi:hypothetical protein
MVGFFDKLKQNVDKALEKAPDKLKKGVDQALDQASKFENTARVQITK